MKNEEKVAKIIELFESDDNSDYGDVFTVLAICNRFFMYRLVDQGIDAQACRRSIKEITRRILDEV